MFLSEVMIKNTVHMLISFGADFQRKDSTWLKLLLRIRNFDVLSTETNFVEFQISNDLPRSSSESVPRCRTVIVCMRLLASFQICLRAWNLGLVNMLH